jgi:hypothetical protein
VVPAVWKFFVFYIIIHAHPGWLKLSHSFLKYGARPMLKMESKKNGLRHLVENHSATVWGILRHFFYINQQNFIVFSNSRFCLDSFRLICFWKKSFHVYLKICFSFRPKIFVKLYFLTNPNVIVNIGPSSTLKIASKDFYFKNGL